MAATKTTKETKTKSQTVLKSKKRNMKNIYKNKYILAGVAVLFLGGAAYFGRSLFIAAMVNGTPISRLKVISELESQAGAQTLDQLVTEVLISQEAKKRGVSVSDEEVQTEINNLRSELEGQGQNLDDLLALQGISEDVLKQQFYLQLSVEKMFADGVNVTDEQVNDYVESLGDSAPDLSEEELLSQARVQLEQQEMVTNFQNWLQEAKADSEINYFVNY